MEKFSFMNWYPQLAKHTIESIAIPIQNDVLTYLRKGSLVLPKEAVPAREHHSGTEWSDSDDDEEEQPTFPAFSAQLKNAMNNLGGEVFIKTNWSSAKDATWIATNKSLKCSSLEDIYLLLKSSDCVAKDLSYQFQEGDSSGNNGYCVVLKQWKEIHPGSEYRCYVMENQLIAVSQRDCTTYYDHIQAAKYDILEDIINFYKKHIHKKIEFTTYTMDVTREDRRSVTLVDLGPLDALSAKTPLFSWAELSQLSVDRAAGTAFKPEFRFIGEDIGLQPNQGQHFGVPLEVSQLCSQDAAMSLIDRVSEAIRHQTALPEDD